MRSVAQAANTQRPGKLLDSLRPARNNHRFQRSLAAAMMHEDWQSVAPTVYAESGPGVTWLSDWGVAAFTGTDVPGFLQGYLTSDARALEPETLKPTALCNIKGRVVINGWAYASPQGVNLIHHASLSSTLASLLALYLRFSRTTLSDRTSDTLILGALDLPPIAGALRCDDRRQLVLCENVIAAESITSQHPVIARAVWDAALIADGVALLTDATRDAFLPQMLDLPRLGAVSFAKGCYLGQEVVARAQHRGQVKRHLSRVTWQGETEPVPGSELMDGSARVRGQVIMACTLTPRTEDSTPRAGTALAVLQDDTAFPLQTSGAIFTGNA